MKVDPFIQTFTGRKLDYSEITKGSIHITDIAHSLALQCRFCGHTKTHYSVAQHSVIVSQILPDHLALDGLLHDAAEAYIHDMNKPLKDYLDDIFYSLTEYRILNKIYEKFKIDFDLINHPAIKEADLMVLRSEAMQVLSHPPIDGWHEDLPKKDILITEWPWELAEKLFLKRFNELKPSTVGDK